MPGLSRAAPSPGSAGRHSGRAEHFQGVRTERYQGAGVFPLAGTDGKGTHDRRPDFEGDRRAAGLSGQRGSELPDPVPGGGHPVRRRGPAHSAGDPDRFQPDGRIVHSGRALHRPAPAGQRQAAQHPQADAGSGQHPDRGGARRGHHVRRRLDCGRGPRRGRSRRRDRGGGHGTGHSGQSQVSDGAIFKWQTVHFAAGKTPGAEGLAHCAGRAGEQPEENRRFFPAGRVLLRHRGQRLGQIQSGQRDSL